MTPRRLRARVRDVLDAVLRPWGIALAPRSLVERGRRATFRGALEHLSRIGFRPRTVIDVGVADGTIPLYEAFPEARIILVEPLEEARAHLEAITTRFPRAEYVLAAAAARAGRMTLNVHRDLSRTSRFWESGFEAASVSQREVPAVTLDDVRRERALEGPLLLKVDVEGAELDVLDGARETLVETEYVILEVSLFEFHDGRPLLHDVVRYMRAEEFVPYDVLDVRYRPLDGAVSMVDMAFVKSFSSFRASHRFHSHPR